MTIATKADKVASCVSPLIRSLTMKPRETRAAMNQPHEERLKPAGGVFGFGAKPVFARLRLTINKTTKGTADENAQQPAKKNSPSKKNAIAKPKKISEKIVVRFSRKSLATS